ncbi:NAD-dependent epimerase/dehydratase family protein [Rhodopseudomonas parapalustris]
MIGTALTARLQRDSIATLALGSADVDLQAAGAAEALSSRLRGDDALVFLAALPPDKRHDLATLMANLRMAQAVACAVASAGCRHLLYLSSDAVYPLDDGVIDETTPADPVDLYGVMHRTREVMLARALPAVPLAVLRATMVCAAGDTHLAYGPNRFRREAARSGTITLFGEGDETRDYVCADDVAGLIMRVLLHRSTGLLNLVSGRSYRFEYVARRVAACFAPPPRIVNAAPGGPVTHRRFDASAVTHAFPEFRLRPLEEFIGEIAAPGP